MHAPRPYGLFYGKDELSVDDVAAVEAFARSLSNFKAVSELDNVKRTRKLPSGRVAVAVDMGGVFRVLVSEPYAVPDYIPDGIAHDYVPMFFSGVITHAMVLANQGVGMKLTEQCRRRLSAYGKLPIPPKDVELMRFRIEYPEHLQHFKPEYTGIYTFTQYMKMRAGWHSGTIAEVVQVMGGYGRQVFDDLPESSIERAVFALPEKVRKKVQDELAQARLPAYLGFPNPSGQFVYSYTHGKTHAVGFDTAMKPWLLRVSRDGVYAMPLPLIPATTTKAFREYVEDCGDEEILHILDRFGGMPSGEDFPVGEAFAAWQRAGCIIKVCDTGDFYEKTAMYEACGWSFNEYASEGFNTCFSYGANGLMQVYGYKLKLSLAQASNDGWQYDHRNQLSDSEQKRLDDYLGKVLAAVGKGASGLAIRYKIRRAKVADILSRTIHNVAAEVQYWDNLVMPPIATHSGNVARVTSGQLFNPSVYVPFLRELKFPVLNGQGCASFACDNAQYILNGGQPIRCDTVVWGGYVDNQLQVIKYFYDERKYTKEVKSTFEEPMIVGSWEKTETTGATGLMGHFYTSAFDDRQEAPPTSIYTKIVGKDLGYGQPAYLTPALLFRVGAVFRARYYSHKTEVRTTAGFGLSVAVCVPIFERDCVLYAYQDWTSDTSYKMQTSLHGMEDPTSYELWTHDDIFHFMGGTRSGNKGEPPPKEGLPVYVDTMNYNPTEFSDYADSGDWLGLGGGVLNVTGICGAYTSRKAVHHANGVIIGGAAPRFREEREFSTTAGKGTGRVSVSLQTAGNTMAHREKPHNWYYDVSPVFTGGSLSYFYRDAVAIKCGLAEYACTSEVKDNNKRITWGFSALADNETGQCFVGVINE